jgi:hypothetical protein
LDASHNTIRKVEHLCVYGAGRAFVNDQAVPLKIIEAIARAEIVFVPISIGLKRQGMWLARLARR